MQSNCNKNQGSNRAIAVFVYQKSKGIPADLKRYLTIRVIGFKYRRIKSSSLQSLERGRRTEIDYLNGYICEKGKALGVPTPLNTAVKAMVMEIENSRRPMSLDNLAKLAAPIGDE